MTLSLEIKRRNAGCTLHPRSRCKMHRKCAHEHRGSAETIRHSLRKGAYGVGTNVELNQRGTTVVFTFVSRSAIDLAAARNMGIY